MDKTLLAILACPICKSSIQHQAATKELICLSCRLAYPIQDDIPVMLADEARSLANDE
jgi:uncharacterized protein YbaR (Trm112 family)